MAPWSLYYRTMRRKLNQKKGIGINRKKERKKQTNERNERKRNYMDFDISR